MRPMNGSLIDTISGTFGGVSGVIAGQPLDTIKVRLQSQSKLKPLYRGPIDCLFKIVKTEGVFYFNRSHLDYIKV